LTNANKSLLQSGAVIFLIEKEFVQFKLALENKQQILSPKQNRDREVLKQNSGGGRPS